MWGVLAMVAALTTAAIFTSSTESQLIRENRLLISQLDTCINFGDSFLDKIDSLENACEETKIGKDLSSAPNSDFPLIQQSETYQEKKARLFLKR
jgi:hypothetical protein